MKIIVVVPTYNEVGNIENCINAILSEFKSSSSKNTYGILVTDANSSDKTADVVKKLQSQSIENIELIEEKCKQGLGKAYIDAFNFAFETLNADAVMTYDADLSHDHTKIPLFIEAFENGAKYVIGSRYRKGGGIPDEWGIHRKFLSGFGNLFVRVLYFNANITDFTAGYKLISKEVFYRIKDKISVHKGYTFAISTNLEAVRAGYKVKEIPYKFKERTAGQSKMTTEYILNGFKFVVEKRIEDILQIRFARVFLAGGIGAVAQLLFYGIVFFPLVESVNIFGLPLKAGIYGIEFYPRFFVSQMCSIEIGILTTFLVNNLWSFSDKKLSGLKLIRGFIKNHVVVIGAIILQLIVGQLLAMAFGHGFIRHYIYQVAGILVGLIWNFYFYKKIIWKVHK